MEQFHLIIRKTTTGLTTEYSSPGIDPQHPNVIKTLEDERAYATQIVKESDIYSLEITNNFRIYSLIVTDLDKFGRSGYYEFKLYGPRDYSLENFDAILQEIKAKYSEDTSKKPYESILSTILFTQNNSITNYISGKQNNKKYYTFYDEANLDSLKEIFREKGGYLINKLYALNRLKAYEENVIQSVGLLAFSMGHFREVVISNPDRVLKELFLNNEILAVNTFKEKFKILVEPKDVLTYSTTDSRTVKTIMGSFAEIKRKPPVYKHVPTNYPPAKKKSFLKENGVYLLALIIMIGGAIYGFPEYKHLLGLGSNKILPPPPLECQKSISDYKTYMFDKNIDEKGEHYSTSFRGLGHYIFTYKDSTWTFKNIKGLDETTKFTKDDIKDLKIDNIPVLTTEEQSRFITALEKESNQSIGPVKVTKINDPVDTSSKNTEKKQNQSKNKGGKDKKEALKTEGNNPLNIGGDTNKDID